MARKNRQAAIGTFFLHLIPGGAAADQVSQGEYGEAAISAAGDLFLVAGAATKAAKVVTVAGMAVEGGIAAYRGYQGIEKLTRGDTIGAAGDAGEVVLRLIGVKLSASELKSLKIARNIEVPPRPVHGGAAEIVDAVPPSNPKKVLEVLKERDYRLIETSPIPIPGDAQIEVRASGSGAITANYEWDAPDGFSYKARFHDASPGAPPGSPPSWGIERFKRGAPDGTRRITEIYIGDGSWIDQYTWKRYIAAYNNGTATEGMLNILRRGHFLID